MSASVRARHPQTMLTMLQSQHPDLHAAIVRELTDAARLQAAMPVEWLPVSVDIELVDRVARALSPGVVDELVRTRQRDEMGSALFKTFISMAGKLLGLSPATLMRQLDKGWGQVFRDCGRIEVDAIEDHGGVARIVALPSECLASRAWIQAIPVGMHMLYELVSAKGTVTATRAGGDLELRFAW